MPVRMGFERLTMQFAPHINHGQHGQDLRPLVALAPGEMGSDIVVCANRKRRRRYWHHDKFNRAKDLFAGLGQTRWTVEDNPIVIVLECAQNLSQSFSSLGFDQLHVELPQGVVGRQ